MKTLINTITEQTQELKIKFLEQTEEWTKKEIERLINVSEKYKTSKHYSEENGYISERKAYNEICLGNDFKYRPKTQEIWINKQIDNAKKHYENSVEKLAYRIIEKGLDKNKIELKTGHVGVNLETTL